MLTSYLLVVQVMVLNNRTCARGSPRNQSRNGLEEGKFSQCLGLLWSPHHFFFSTKLFGTSYVDHVDNLANMTSLFGPIYANKTKYISFIFVFVYRENICFLSIYFQEMSIQQINQQVDYTFFSLLCKYNYKYDYQVVCKIFDCLAITHWINCGNITKTGHVLPP